MQSSSQQKGTPTSEVPPMGEFAGLAAEETPPSWFKDQADFDKAEYRYFVTDSHEATVD